MNETSRCIGAQYTGGGTNYIVAVSAIVGYAFAPRIGLLPPKRLHTFEPTSAPKEPLPLIGGKVKVTLIAQN